MSAPSMVQRSGDALIVRSVVSGHRLYASDAPDSDHSETELPQCKIKRNYNCTHCTFFTHNPRAHLQHLRDVHDERMQIYDCPHCVYASRHHQKLSRHIKMVHDPSHDGGRSTPSPLTADAADIDVHDEAQDADVDATAAESSAGNRPLDLHCGLCPYTTASRAAYAKHSRKQHGSKHTPLAEVGELPDSTKLYPCDKCNYVTDIRSRYTKHVKYHSMPMIKCGLCDFRTPYKWNLDRHMRNHGGGGAFNCSVCNFTADIKQSLTVHEMNHHTPPACTPALAGSGSRRRKGGSSAGGGEVDRDAPSPDVDRQDNTLTSFDGTDLASIKIVRNESICSNGVKRVYEDAVEYKVEINYANPRYICKYCNFEAASESELHSHENSHGTSVVRKIERPIPNLIPLHTRSNMLSSTSPTEPPLKKFKDMLSITNTEIDLVTIPSSTETSPSKASEDGIQQASTPFCTKEVLPKKKPESFFDKLKERLLTEKGESGSLICKNCSFESKCLSEHSVHEKSCTTLSNRVKTSTLLTSKGSTRCQNCRHRCKSSADLYIHLQTCRGNSDVQQAAEVTRKTALVTIDDTTNRKSPLDKSLEPHPMENVVFVWNTAPPNSINVQEQEVNDEQENLKTSELSIDIDNADTSHDEMHCPSPNKAIGKKVFKCPHCAFWATTASRFHVHIVGHLNRKPFECSMCMYRSNWRWDITKHIRLKSSKDPEHGEAQVLMTDETGRRNYSKYNKYMTALSPNHPKFDPKTLSKQGNDSIYFSEEEASNCSVTNRIDHSIDDDNLITITALPIPQLTTTKTSDSTVSVPEIRKSKKTFWKCKKCDYRHPTKEALLQHVKEQHSRSSQHLNDEVTAKFEKSRDNDNSQFQVYRCGHCDQLSAWKHVIQRHCRLKHSGDIQVIATEKPISDTSVEQKNNQLLSDWPFPEATTEAELQPCSFCPFTSADPANLQEHLLQHSPSKHSIFKCYFCQFFVKTESELIEHLPLHGVSDPEEYFSKALGCKTPISEHVPAQNVYISIPEAVVPIKRYKCSHCPYVTNSKSQFTYHDQFHGRTDSTSYTCELCDYSVTKRHLLNQHMKVHGYATSARSTADGELPMQPSVCYVPDLDAIPHVWVAARNEFHKMYKCRFCSYVNTQRAKIPDHERIHCIMFENDLSIFKCLECKFTSDDPTRLTEHSKKHGEIYGKIYSPVENNVPEKDQIKRLRELLEQENKDRADKMLKVGSGEKDYDSDQNNSEVEKILLFCSKCPARFFELDDWKVHDESHESQHQFTCQVCSYSVVHESDLGPHRTVHTEDYQVDTRLLLSERSTHSCYPQPKIMMVVNGVNSAEPVWIAVPDPVGYENAKKLENNNFRLPNKQYACDICPAKFFKTAALSYHLTLHGGDGAYKCRKCNYAVKTIGNVVKHEMVHDKSELSVQINYDMCDEPIYQSVPISGTDLFQRKTEAERRETLDSVLVRPNDHFPPVLQADPQFGFLMHGNPDFIYPKYIKNGREKEKRYKCHKCPSAFEKREQYKVHLSLHGSKQRYKCEACDYSVKYYANYVQHVRKHQMNADAQAARGHSYTTVKTEPEDAEIKMATKNTMKSILSSPYTDNDQQAIKILQRRRSNVTNNHKDPPTEEKRYLYCPHCPYLNPRRDALENHLRRHRGVSGSAPGGHDCLHCDYSAPQSHFLREHIKVHFNLQKHQLPDCFVKTDHTTLIVTEVGEDKESTKINLLKRKGEKIEKDVNENKIYVNARTGEMVQGKN